MFTDAPRVAAQNALGLILSGGNSVAAKNGLIAILTAKKLLQYESSKTVGEKLWTTKIVPGL